LSLSLSGGRTVTVFFDVDDLACAEDAGGTATFAVFVLGVAPGWVVGVADVEATVVHA